MAASATLHCITGCAIGEVIGLVIGAGAGLGSWGTTALSIALAFVFGYGLSTLPLLRGGEAVGVALITVFAADTLSIAVMEIVDNVIMVLMPGAMDAGLADEIFWVSMIIALVAAFFAAYPVNRMLLRRGKGHALTHRYHHLPTSEHGWRRWIPDPSSAMLVGIIVSFVLGGLLVASSVPTVSHDAAHAQEALVE